MSIIFYDFLHFHQEKRMKLNPVKEWSSLQGKSFIARFLFRFISSEFFRFVKKRFNVAILLHPCSSRNEFSDNNVLLQSEEFIPFSFDRCIGSTRVVSWKDAADKKESVSREAFVIPSNTGRPVAGWPPLSSTSLFASLN